MRLGIDATNVGGGGGVTHLKEVIEHYDAVSFKNKISSIIIFSSQRILDLVEDQEIVEKVTFAELNQGLFKRVLFQLTKYDKEIEKRCDVLFSITGDYVGDFKPVIGMSRNMLLYERDIWREIKQPKEIIRFWLNYQKQKKCFSNSSGIIFISEYAKKYISNSLNITGKKKEIIHHGVSPRFIGEVKKQLSIENYSFKDPYKIVYVSTVHVYKHQWNVVKAIAQLRKRGLPLELYLIGGVTFEPAEKLLLQTILKEDPTSDFVNYIGHIPYEEIENYYKKADGIIYASTCENMPNTLIESMASGVPIACSDKQPMPEFLEEGGYYFNAKSPDSIAHALEEMVLNPERRLEMAEKNIIRSEKYRWSKTSTETFNFILNTTNQIRINA